MSHLYLIQNDTHLKNFKKMIQKNDKYIDLGRLTGQNLREKEQISGMEILLPIKHCNFFNLPPIKRLYFILKNKRKIKETLAAFEFEKVIIGNDGAIQKLIIESLYNKEMIHIDMWLDGLISLNSSRFLNTIKIINSKIFEYLNLGFIMPSVIGFYSKINVIYIMHESILTEYKKFRPLININKIKSTTFPRHEELLKNENNTNLTKLTVLYLTSAWEFHGKKIEQKKQREQIMSLIESLTQDECISFRIRVHPRDYDGIYSNKNISQWLSDFTNFEDDIINSHIVISARSTGLLEASMINKKVIIYNLGFGNDYLNQYTQTLDKCESPSELLNLINKYK